MNIWRKIKQHVYVLYFTFKSLTYNSSRPKHHYIDACFEPLFWFIDNIASYMGLLFVIAVTVLTSSVVCLWYLFLLPVLKTYSTTRLIFHVVLAHYLLINIVFHYFKAVFTCPGTPPQKTPLENIPGAVVCKKCIQPKPPRTHHCSICNKCFLKMDHHCPWMNNCIGFYNHRYFVSFCIFMWLGTVYVSVSTFDLFTYHFNHPGTLLSSPKRAVSLSFALGLGPMLDNLLSKLQINSTHFVSGVEETIKNYRPHPGGFTEVHEWEHIGIIYLFLLCAAVAVALGLLNTWHMVLVSRGETSIEVHINSSEREKAAKRGMGYNNMYSYGVKGNLKEMFGLTNDKTIWSVLFPSGHPPNGDGISWADNKKPIHYPDPEVFAKYERSKNLTWRKLCPC